MVDCTANPSVVDAYPAFIDANLHIITPNKRANALPWKQYSALMEQMARAAETLLLRSNVGAGLPIMSTLRDLIASGDEILKSGGHSLGHAQLSLQHVRRDDAVQRAGERGASRRIHRARSARRLSGQDVASKLLILAREIGLKMELDEVTVDSLVPRALRRMASSPAGSFRLSRATTPRSPRRRSGAGARRRAAIRRRCSSAAARRRGSRNSRRRTRVAPAKGSDNVIAFTTSRYRRTPLVVQGPGAGADVTAMGVFSDILKLLALPARVAQTSSGG